MHRLNHYYISRAQETIVESAGNIYEKRKKFDAKELNQMMLIKLSNNEWKKDIFIEKAANKYIKQNKRKADVSLIIERLMERRNE